MRTKISKIQSGATLAEYCSTLMTIALICVVTLHNVGEQTGTIFLNLSGEFISNEGGGIGDGSGNRDGGSTSTMNDDETRTNFHRISPTGSNGDDTPGEDDSAEEEEP